MINNMSSWIVKKRSLIAPTWKSKSANK